MQLKEQNKDLLTRMDLLTTNRPGSSKSTAKSLRSPTRPTPSPPSRIVSPTRGTPSKASVSSSSSGPSPAHSAPVKKWRWFSSHFFKSSLSKRAKKYQSSYDYNNVILTKLIPISGCISYSAFAFHVYQPKGLFRYKNTFCKCRGYKLTIKCPFHAFLSIFSYLATQDVPILANCLLFNSHLGIGLYLYSRSHMSYSSTANICITKRLIYSIYGAVLFNFGSILLWATTSSIIPTESAFARTFIAISSSVALLLIGHEYMSHIDYRCRERDKSSDESDEDDDADDESDIHYQNFN